MKYLALTLVALVAALFIRKALRYKTLYPFLPKKYNFGKRRDTLRETLSLLEERGAKTLVETGVARHGLDKCKGDGASTIVFAIWSKANNANLYSVDIDPDAIATAQQTLEQMGLQNVVELQTSDSVAYLRTFNQPVDLLYLDSYDYHKSDTSIQQASQKHHLEEFRAIEDKLHDDSIVLIDDCNMPAGGKGKLVIEYMLTKDWRMHLFDYQALLVRS